MARNSLGGREMDASLASALRIAVADPDRAAAGALALELADRGCSVQVVAHGEPLSAGVRAAQVDWVLLDLSFGLDQLRGLRAAGERVIAMGPPEPARQVVASLRAGARDFLPRPCETAELERVLARAAAAPPRSRHAGSTRMRQLLDALARVADTDVPVLITGESGSGKEHVADLLRAASRRHAGPFIKVNCAALPGALLESELFGFERGAFTGAEQRKLGKFELASGGTLLLDEVAELALPLQAKLLQVLQESRFARLGGLRDVEVDVRILAATHRDLRRAVQEGRFREDLFHRLHGIELRVPPLRERRDEIPELAAQFLRSYARQFGRPESALSGSLRDALVEYAWPGNVRELENLIQRRVVFGRDEPLLAELSERSAARRATVGSRGELERFLAGELSRVSLKRVAREAAARAEGAAIASMLERTRWNRRRAAQLLRVSYKALLYKMREAGLGAET
jgi:two-component system, NtrC family, response regulator AtoC